MEASWWVEIFAGALCSRGEILARETIRQWLYYED